MPHKSVLRLWCAFLLFGAETMGQPEELNGTLGASAVFRVKTAPPYERISWSRLASGHPRVIAVVTSEGTCSIVYPHPDVQNRLNVSRDCRELYLSHLKREDAGRYTGGIILPDKKLVDESFELRVFRRLLDSQLRVTCTPDGAGNGTWQLNCSTGSWEDRANISWTSAAKSADPNPGSSVIQFDSQDLNASCTAVNPVSQASRTVSLKDVCAERRPVTEAPQENDDGQHSSGPLIGGIIAAVLLVLLVIAAICVWKKRAAKENQRFTPQAEIENPARSDYTVIGNLPKETQRKANQPARRAAKAPQEMPHTIYTAVQHPKPNPLQTDDEKMQKGRRRCQQDQGEKTIYSEITKPQESDHPNIKTIYDTVQSLPPVKSSDPLCATAPLSKASRGCPPQSRGGSA